jgi:hypothetical protein
MLICADNAVSYYRVEAVGLGLDVAPTMQAAL